MDNSDAVRALRKQLGWTQKRLAGELRKSEHTVKRWEMGIREPSPEILEKLAALAALAGGRLSRFFAERAGLPRKGLVYLHVREGVATSLSAPLPSARLSPAERLARHETNRVDNDDARQHQLLASILRGGNRKAIEAVTKTLEAFADTAPAHARGGKNTRRQMH